MLLQDYSGLPWRRPVATGAVGSLALMPGVPFRHPEFEVDADKPFEQDKVGREAFVQELCIRVMAQEQPAVVAITGGFGTGKSVVLQMCAAVLRAEGRDCRRVQRLEAESRARSANRPGRSAIKRARRCLEERS